MATTTGAAPTILSLIDAIRVFLGANGWTNNYYGDDQAGKRLHLSKDGVFINFRACVNENPYDAAAGVIDLENATQAYGLWANISTGFDSSSERWYRQPGATNRIDSVNQPPLYEYCGIVNLNSGLNYWLFAFDTAVYIVTESPAGIFQWMGFGNLSPKFGDWGGGQFLFAKHAPGDYNSNKNFPLFSSAFGGQGQVRSYLRVNGIDGVNGWVRGYNTGNASGNMRAERLFDSSSRQSTLWEVAPNMLTGKPVPLPFSIWMTRNGYNVDQNAPISYLGGLEKIFFINFSGLLPAQLYPDGSGAVYRIFPFHQKVDETNMIYPNYVTGTLGFAIKTN